MDPIAKSTTEFPLRTLPKCQDLFSPKARSLSLPRQSTVRGIAYLHPPDDPPSLCADMDFAQASRPAYFNEAPAGNRRVCRQRSHRLKGARDRVRSMEPQRMMMKSLHSVLGRALKRRKKCKSVAFVICTERHFEKKSLLLVRSLRHFGGALGANSPIISYSPRQKAAPSDDVIRQLAALDVQLVFDVSNSRWPDYPFANKVVACAHAEQNLNVDVVVWLDSDQIVLREPGALQLSPDIDAAARPVSFKNIGFGSDDDASYSYWMKLYEIGGALPKRKVETTLGGEVIWEYYNGGLIAARRNAGIFCHCEHIIGRILEIWSISPDRH